MDASSLRVEVAGPDGVDTYPLRLQSGPYSELVAREEASLDEMANGFVDNYQVLADEAALTCEAWLREGWPDDVSFAVELVALDAQGRIVCRDAVIGRKGIAHRMVRELTLMFESKKALDEFMADPSCRILLRGSRDLAWRDVWMDCFWGGTTGDLKHRWRAV